MKDWFEIIKMYSKDNIYLGEVASLLLRNVNYEVPALKKQIAKTIHSRSVSDFKFINSILRCIIFIKCSDNL